MSTDRSRRVLMDDDASSLLSLDPGAILGVRPDATARELRTAYRRALLAAHPDQGGSREELDLVRSAYDRLRDAAPADDAAVRRPTPDRSTTTTQPVSGRPAFLDLAPTDETTDLAPAPTPEDTASVPVDLGSPHTIPAAPAGPTLTPAGARAAAKFVTAQRFATVTEPAAPTRRRRVSERTRSRFEQLLERELVRRSDRRVRLTGATDHAEVRT